MDFYCGSCTSEPGSSNYYAILDSGANYNFFTSDADVDEKDSNHNPIKVTMPNNTAAMSSHKCKVKVPLPEPANKGFVLPELNHSLLAVRLLVKAGCEVKFVNDKCIVTYKGNTIMSGIQKSNGLWYVPISPKGRKYFIDDGKQQAVANSAYHQATMPETIKFIHQCLFSPTVDTLCKAIDNNQLIGFPSLTSE